jgi:hypothetical protein
VHHRIKYYSLFRLQDLLSLGAHYLTYRRSRLDSFKAMENRGSKIWWIKDNISSAVVVSLL